MENGKSGKCIIVCAGEFVPVVITRSPEDLVIAADGGYQHCLEVNLVPDLVIGDFDSVTEAVREEIGMLQAREPERVITLPCAKDDTDTLAAIREGLSRGYRKFYLYGAAGGRMDHTIANIQTLQYIKNQGAKGYLMSHDMMMTVIRNEEIRFHAGMTGTLSVFALGEKAEGVTIRNLRYETEDTVLTNDFPIGVSNSFIGKEGTVSVRNGSLLVCVIWEVQA